jgi:hypothetical protein
MKTDPPVSLAQVTVYTSDLKFAGTDAVVVVCLVGDKGSSGEQILSNSKNNFERGKVDVFALAGLPNVGALKHITLGHDNSMVGAAWHVKQVEVYCVNSGETVLFPVDRWFATSEAPYECTQTLYPAVDGKVRRSSMYPGCGLNAVECSLTVLSLLPYCSLDVLCMPLNVPSLFPRQQLTNS